MVKDYVVFDLETTGLSPDKDTIIEIGALKVIQGKVADRFSMPPYIFTNKTYLSMSGISSCSIENPSNRCAKPMTFLTKTFVRSTRVGIT